MKRNYNIVSKLPSIFFVAFILIIGNISCWANENDSNTATLKVVREKAIAGSAADMYIYSVFNIK